MKTHIIKLDKERTLKYPNSSVQKLEELLGGGVFEIIKIDSNMTMEQMKMAIVVKFASISMISKVVYCGLLWNGTKTMEEVIDMIPMNRVVAVATECVDIIVQIYGLDQEEIKPDKSGKKK